MDVGGENGATGSESRDRRRNIPAIPVSSSLEIIQKSK